ncbi:CDP-alcohol phosphatidyltransferase family protein [bacterium]|nr:CDP-alcohol phosphatidyltransferase family protein [bacterium]
MKRTPRSLPMIMTLGNMACGIVAMLLSMRGHFESAVPLVLMAAVLDAMDGWAARKLKIAGVVGAKADTIADVVSFAAAPSVLVGNVLGGIQGYIFGGLFAGFILARLIRYHLRPMPRGVFLGLPSPTAAMPVVMVTVLATRGILPDFAPMAAVLIFGGFAVSSIRFPGWHNPALQFLPPIGMKLFYGIGILSLFLYPVYTTLALHLLYIFAGTQLLKRFEKKMKL